MTNDGTVTQTTTNHPALSSQVVIPSIVHLDSPKIAHVASDNGRHPLSGQTTVVTPIQPVLAASTKPNVVHQKRPSLSAAAASQPQNINILVCPAPCIGRCAGNCPQECCHAQTQNQQSDQSMVVCQRPCINNCTKSCPSACCSLTQQQVTSAEKSPYHTYSYYGSAPPDYSQTATSQSQPANMPCQDNTACLHSGNSNGYQSNIQGTVVSQGKFIVHPNGQVTGSKKEVGKQRGSRLKIQIISPNAHLKGKSRAGKIIIKKHFLSHVSPKEQEAAATSTSRRDRHKTLEMKLASMKTNVPSPSKRNQVHKAEKINDSANKVISRTPRRRVPLSAKRHYNAKRRSGHKQNLKHLKGRVSISVQRQKGGRRKAALKYKPGGRFRRSCECQTICKKSKIINPGEEGCVTKCSGCPNGYGRYRKNELIHSEDSADSKEENVRDIVTDEGNEEEELVDYVDDDSNSEETGTKKSETVKNETVQKDSTLKGSKGKLSNMEKVVTGTKKEEILGATNKGNSNESALDEEEEIEDVSDNNNEEEGEEIVKDEERTVELMGSEFNEKKSKKRKDEIDLNTDSDNKQSSQKSIKHRTVTTEDEFGNKEIVESEIADPADTSDDERISEGEKKLEKISTSNKELKPLPYNFTSGEEVEEKLEVVDGDNIVNEEKGSEFSSEVNKDGKKVKSVDHNESKDYSTNKRIKDEKEEKGKHEESKQANEEGEVTVHIDDAENKEIGEETKQKVKSSDETSSESGRKEKGKEERTMPRDENANNEINGKGKDTSSVEDSKQDSTKDNKEKTANNDSKSFEKSYNDTEKYHEKKKESADDERKESELGPIGKSAKPATLSINVEDSTPVTMDEVVQRPLVDDAKKEKTTNASSSEDQMNKAEEVGKSVSSVLSDKTSSHLSDQPSDESGSEDSKPNSEERPRLLDNTSTSGTEGKRPKEEDKSSEASDKEAKVDAREKTREDPYADIGSSDAGVDNTKKFAKKEDGGGHNDKGSLLGDESRHMESVKENKTVISDSFNSKNPEYSSTKDYSEKPTSILENFKAGGSFSDTGFFMDAQIGVKNRESVAPHLEAGRNEKKQERTVENSNYAAIYNGSDSNNDLVKQVTKQENLKTQTKQEDQESQDSLRETQSKEKQKIESTTDAVVDSEYTKKPGQEIKSGENAKGEIQDNTVTVSSTKPAEPVNPNGISSEDKTSATNSVQFEYSKRKPKPQISLREFQTNEERPDEITFQENYDDPENDNKVATDTKGEHETSDSSSLAPANETHNATKNAKQTETHDREMLNTLNSSKEEKANLSKQAVVNDSRTNDKDASMGQAADEKEKYKSDSGSSNSKSSDKSAQEKEGELFAGSGKSLDKSEDAYKEIASGDLGDGQTSLHFTPVNVFTDVDKNGDLVEVEKDDPEGSIVTMTVDREGNEEDAEGGDEMSSYEGAAAEHKLRKEKGNKGQGGSDGAVKSSANSSFYDDIDDSQDIDAEKEAIETYNTEHSENEEMTLDALAKILDDLDKSVDSIRVKNGAVRHEVSDKAVKKVNDTEVEKGKQEQVGNKTKINKNADKEHLEGRNITKEDVKGYEKNKNMTENEEKTVKQGKSDKRKHKLYNSFSKMRLSDSATGTIVRKVPFTKFDADKKYENEEVDAAESQGAESDSSDIVTGADRGRSEDEAVEVVEPNDVLLFTKDADSRAGDWFEKVVKPKKSHKVIKKKKYSRKNYAALEDWDGNFDDSDSIDRYEDEDGIGKEDEDEDNAYYDEDSKKEKENFVAEVSNIDNTMSTGQIKEINKAIMRDDDVQFVDGSKHLDTNLFDLPDEQDDIANQVKESSKGTMEKIANALNAENKVEDQNSFPDDLVSTKFFNRKISDKEIDQYTKGVDDMSSDSLGTPLKSLDPLYGTANNELTAKSVEEKAADVKHAIPQNAPLTKQSAEGENVNGPDSSFDGGDEFLNPEPQISTSESAKVRQAIIPMRRMGDFSKEAVGVETGKNMLKMLVKGPKAKKLQQKLTKAANSPAEVKKKIPKAKKPVLKKILGKRKPALKKPLGKMQPRRIPAKKQSSPKSALGKKKVVPKKGPTTTQAKKKSKPLSSTALKEGGSKLAQLVQQVVRPKSSQPISKVQKLQKLNDSLTLIDEMESQIDKELQRNDTPVTNEAGRVSTDESQGSDIASNAGAHIADTSSPVLGFHATPTEQVSLKSLLPEYGTESPGMKVSYVNEQEHSEKPMQFPNPQEEESKQASLVLRDMNSEDHHARLKQAKALLQMQKYEADNALSSVKDIQSKAMDDILKTSMERQKAFVDKIANKYEKDYYSQKSQVEDPPVNEEDGNLDEAGEDSDTGIEDRTLPPGRIVKLYSDNPLPSLNTNENDNDDPEHTAIVQKDGVADSDEDSSTESPDGLDERDLHDKDVDSEDDRRIREMSDENEDDESESEESSKNDSNPDDDVDNNDDDDDDSDE